MLHEEYDMLPRSVLRKQLLPGAIVMLPGRLLRPQITLHSTTENGHLVFGKGAGVFACTKHRCRASDRALRK